MRYAIGVLCLVGSLALLYAGLRPPPPPVVPPTPDFTIDTPVKDFGEVEQMSELRHTFTLTNTHPEPVEVLNVMKSCSCAVAEVTPKVIPPGGTAKLEVLWKVGKSRGKSGSGLSVHYSINGRQPQFIICQMTADVQLDFVCEPEKIVFDTTKFEWKEIKLRARGEHEIKLVGASANHPSFAVSLQKEKNGSYIARITLDKLKPTPIPGQYKIIIYSSGNTETEVSLPIQIITTEP